MDILKCYRCLQMLPIESFYRSRSAKRKVGIYCKECCRILYRERRKKHPEVFKRKEENYYRNHKKDISERRKRWYAENRHKQVAHNAVKVALYRGDIRKEPCSVCGDKKSVAHHPDYSKPLNVVWLCPTHHLRIHAESE